MVLVNTIINNNTTFSAEYTLSSTLLNCSVQTISNRHHPSIFGKRNVRVFLSSNRGFLKRTEFISTYRDSTVHTFIMKLNDEQYNGHIIVFSFLRL